MTPDAMGGHTVSLHHHASMSAPLAWCLAHLVKGDWFLIQDLFWFVHEADAAQFACVWV